MDFQRKVLCGLTQGSRELASMSPNLTLSHRQDASEEQEEQVKDSPVTLTTEVFSPRPLNCSQSLGDHGTRNNKMLFLEGPQGFT